MNSTPRDENVLTDIRTCQEIVAKSHNDKIAAICRILQGCAMPDTSGMAQSLFENGLDCLTLVCRTNLSRYVSHSFNPSPVEQADQEKNPVLPFLWSSLNLVKHPDDEHHRLEALEILSNAKQDILRRIIALGLLDSKNLDFLSLTDSDIMNETLWSQPQFRLYDTVIRREQGEREWHLVPRPGRREQGQRSLLSLCAAEDPHQPLQEFIDSNIGPRDCEDGSQEIWMSDKPRIVRIQYEPCANAPANFQELRRFDMPIYNCKEAVAWANIRPDILKAHVSWHYELGSVVKVGATARHNSYVRTYSQGGGHRRLDARGTKTVNNLWKLDGATSGVYLLVYHWTAHEQSQIYSAEVQPKYGSDRITGADGVELINGFLNKLDLEEPSAESQNVGDTNTASSARPATGNRNVPVDAGTAQPDNPVPVQDQGDPRQSQPEPARPSDASHPSRNVRNETQEQSSSRRGTSIEPVQMGALQTQQLAFRPRDSRRPRNRRPTQVEDNRASSPDRRERSHREYRRSRSRDDTSQRRSERSTGRDRSPLEYNRRHSGDTWSPGRRDQREADRRRDFRPRSRSPPRHERSDGRWHSRSPRRGEQRDADRRRRSRSPHNEYHQSSYQSYRPSPPPVSTQGGRRRPSRRERQRQRRRN
ncbi:hypothetical protein J3458_019051 [Metarhizium acridum]|uniref:uncharacterized protein n=1 Tax=Metarhizium acridum TaxID=92637 RepID=UPI001C6C109C|nr:hypothetical protein J3458_019051 [Metarhizium acridum]